MAPGWSGRDFEENSAMANDSLDTTLSPCRRASTHSRAAEPSPVHMAA